MKNCGRVSPVPDKKAAQPLEFSFFTIHFSLFNNPYCMIKAYKLERR